MALVERHQGESDVHDEGRVQRHGRWNAAPEVQEDVAGGLPRLERDQARRMVRQVARQVGEQHQPGGEPESASSKLHGGRSRCHETFNRPPSACARSSSSKDLHPRSSTRWRGNAFGGITRLASALSRATPTTATSTCWCPDGYASPPTRRPAARSRSATSRPATSSARSPRSTKSLAAPTSSR